MTPDAVRHTILVPAPPAVAFQVFTAQIGRWWPRSHSRSGDPATSIFLEGRAGGRLYERTPTGAEYEWGQVLVWEPPQRLAYHWYLGSGDDLPSRVDVFFADAGDGRTRVEVAHRGPELLGELWARNSPIYDRSWPTVLAAYAAVI